MYKWFEEEHGITFSKKEKKRQMDRLDKGSCGVLLNRRL